MGSPALMDAWRATFWPRPAWITHPMYTWSTSLGLTPALFSASLITTAPSSAAGVVLSDPPMVPMAVRHAPAKTTFFAICFTSKDF